MRSTRPHAIGGAIVVATVVVWLLLAARLSNDPPMIPPPDSASDSQPAATIPADLPLTLPDDAIRALQGTAERAARDTLLTTSPGKGTR